MAENPTFQIPKEIIQPIINSHVAVEVAKALGDINGLAGKVIDQALRMPVDGEGKYTNYSGKPWIEWVVGDTIRSAAKEVVQTALAEHKDKLMAALTDELKKKNSPLVKQLVLGMIGAATHPDVLKYRFDISYKEGR